ncbi:hypothetical protein [Enterococcus rotai]|uniref:hypothetical protein n=1 Tax=Enterococcus rotai TaxID=118060 RepID=UPI0032B433EF
MSENEKKILENAMKKIKVPEEESLNALATGLDKREYNYRRPQYKWGEIILSSIAIVCLCFVTIFMWQNGKEMNEPSTLTSTEGIKEIPENILQSTPYWKIQNEENYFSFSNEKMRIIQNYLTSMTPKYIFKNNRLDVAYKMVNENGDSIDEIHSYQVVMDGNNLILEPQLAEDERLVLEPYNKEIFPYTEESIKKLKPAINPDLTAYSSWTSIVKGNSGLNSTVTFDGFLKKDRIDGEDQSLTMTYEVKDNHLLVNYGGYTVSSDMYWDDENIVLWQVSNTLLAEDEQKFKEESVTVLKPNK